MKTSAKAEVFIIIIYDEKNKVGGDKKYFFQ